MSLRLCSLLLLAAGLTFSGACAATNSFLVHVDSPVAYGAPYVVDAEALLDRDCSVPFVPGSFLLQIDGTPVRTEWTEFFRHCAGFEQVYSAFAQPDVALLPGNHIFTVTYTPDGASAPLGASRPQSVVVLPPPRKFSLSVQDMWWAGPEENGWGLSIAQNGDSLFVGMYIYRDDGTPEWLVLPLGSWNTDTHAYVGELYEPRGSWFGAYDPSAFDAGNAVGQASLTFSSDTSATLDYTIRGVSGRKSISRLPFGSAASPPTQGERAGLWWAGPARAGWGLAIGHQGDTLFSVWYTYAKDGTATWYVMSGGSWSADSYSGPLYRTTGKSWLSGPYDPSAFKVAPVGTMTLHFTGPATATMTYSVDGTSGTESISLQPF